MQTKTFSRLSFAAVLVVSAFVLIRLTRQAASDLSTAQTPAQPSAQAPLEASSTSSAPIQTASVGSIASAASIPDETLPILSVKTPRGTIHAIVAATPASRERGLGDRASLPIDGGMLFVFDQPGDYGFWMKGMNFPLDLIWVLPNKKIAGIARAVSPETYPDVFYPHAQIGYVLELNSGGAAKWGIATGTQLVF
ncbi:MAG: hypothetical protein JWO00_80 [Candidatus Parcubacteria bacterium]|nr:hypothetical protein [Candidatus Parcubacteria bacterium]